MKRSSKTMQRMCVLAGALVLAVTANAVLPFDTHISIDRALNSPTLTIRYTGAHAALVELKVNGDSLGTRSMTAAKDAGETNFNISLSDLKDGDNSVEVRLFDRTGKLIASDKTNISTDQSNKGPVYLTAPKVGATVQGPVEINMAFSKDLKNSIVSFFVDSNFKAIKNYPPYSYVWDTSRESNGWHEVEAWDVDESSQTFKTKKTRVFVNNPGGRTDRPGVPTDLNPTRPTYNAQVEGADSTTREIALGGKSKSAGNPADGVAPKLGGTTTSNPIRVAPASGSSDTQPAPPGHLITEGPRLLAPTNTRVATGAPAKAPIGTIKISVHAAREAVAVKQPSSKILDAASTKSGQKVATLAHPVVPQGVVGGVTRVAHTLAITRGQRIPNIGQFAIEMNSQFVKFDVQPRVDEGVPMTPLRYLLEKDGGKVTWENMTKTVKANADGRSLTIQIGDRNAKVDQITVSMEVTPYLDRGRTIVPLSFIHDALGVNVEYDKETGHVLITSVDKK